MSGKSLSISYGPREYAPGEETVRGEVHRLSVSLLPDKVSKCAIVSTFQSPIPFIEVCAPFPMTARVQSVTGSTITIHCYLPQWETAPATATLFVHVVDGRQVKTTIIPSE